MATSKTSTAKTSTAKKGASKKANRKNSTSSRRYGKKAAEKVQRSMEEMKAGTLRSGGSGKKVTSRKQAIAIGLSEAREAGAKVPARKTSAKTGSTKRLSKRSGRATR
jgi:hypothetical protein